MMATKSVMKIVVVRSERAAGRLLDAFENGVKREVRRAGREEINGFFEREGVNR
jgi:hypothetical protein